ncbi:mechanosensitive ion channel [Mycobacterium sp. Y57]|uniref:mechanosensitive ion channel family protein n=1 Tax=Mycolicibacterium xanthum TaxID=2796469 RepID=UPI001C863464|nr:mechanosensitive ion channel family protein [Mycolicibacterium xanthum]MBX7434606.1 mechanosensitive ion channel [Mycolicibacterium xanthum]
MTDIFSAPWFWWALAIAVALPISLVVLTEIHDALLRRDSYLARPVSLIRNYVLPLGALLLLLVKATEVRADATPVRVVATVLGFVVLVLLLSGLNATVFQSAPEGSWRKRVPSIFLDVARFVLISVGVGLIFAFVWGANIGGLFTALGIGSIVLGLTLQNSVGQVISGLLVLFEQPFQIGDWVATRWIGGGRVVEVNWRATHLDSGNGIYVLPNSLLATEWFINLSLPRDEHSIDVVTKFSAGDPPDAVSRTLTAVAHQLPLLRRDAEPVTRTGGSGEFTTTIPLHSPADDVETRSTFLRWVWYAARREALKLDDIADEFPPPAVFEEALRIVGRSLHLGRTDQEVMREHLRVLRYGAGEIVQEPGSVPAGMQFVVSGRARLEMRGPDGTALGIRTLERGEFLGQTTLTREPVAAVGRAVDELTVAQLDREHIEALVLRRPLLMQEIGRVIEERRARARRLTATAGG